MSLIQIKLQSAPAGAGQPGPAAPAGPSAVQAADLAAVRERLRTSTGKQYWRSLEEAAHTPEFQEILHREFPQFASEWDETDEKGRRGFLKIMGASLAFAGLTACTKQPEETIMPYVRQPEGLIPGKPLFFATAVTTNGVAVGVLAESHMGRPTKIEGNPQHPGSLGATGVIEQASVLNVYDPDRAQAITFAGEVRGWGDFTMALKRDLSTQSAKAGAGLRIVTGTVTSPSLGALMQEVLKAYPQAKWHQFDPTAPHHAAAGARMAFGADVNTVYKFENAKAVLSIDSDFLATGPASVRYARDFMKNRVVRHGHHEMARLYAVEATPTNTGAKADHRLPLKPSEIEAFTAALAAKLGVNSGATAGSFGDQKFLDAVAKDLQAHKGASVVIAGDEASPTVHALVHGINAALGNVGQTVIYTDPVEVAPQDQLAGLRELAADIDAGKVDLLLIQDVNLVYDAPADLKVREKLLKVKSRIYLGTHNDETAEVCQWVVPLAHSLESWGDARAYDGTVTMIQPLIAPLFRSRTPYEVLGVAINREQSSYELVRAYWQTQQAAGFEDWWRKTIHDGFVPNSALPAKTVALKPAFAASAPKTQTGGLEVVVRPDPYLLDGRYANNGWLQELPRPLTRHTWDNVIQLAPKTAEKLGVSSQDVVEVTWQGGKIAGPVWVSPGHAADTVTLTLGYGRTLAGRVGSNVGYNANLVRTSSAMFTGAGAEVKKTGETHKIAGAQGHFLIEGRPHMRTGTLAEYEKNNNFVHEMSHEPPKSLTLYPDWKYDGYAWGMAIDQTSCVGCNACVVACQSENNIPVVGKQQVLAGREMHWLRIDHYYEGEVDNPKHHFQPMACVHCENAPCEVVCPVQATVHSSEGLNDMVYNRCVGTRYCSNNCPYKVRRFNFFLYSDWENATVAMQKNPDVSVRSRGVMEKCTYCVQRINQAKIGAEKEGRQVKDGEILTACQQVCPTQAIVFGDINDPKSRVSELRKEHLSYGTLAEWNTRPRTVHLASLHNPNPEIES